MELDSVISRQISTGATSFHNMDKFMKRLFLYKSKILLNSRLGPWLKVRLKAHPYVPNANLSNLNDFPSSDVPGLV